MHNYILMFSFKQPSMWLLILYSIDHEAKPPLLVVVCVSEDTYAYAPTPRAFQIEVAHVSRLIIEL